MNFTFYLRETENNHNKQVSDMLKGSSVREKTYAVKEQQDSL